MNRTMLAVLIAAGLALAFTPSAEAAPPGTCDVINSTWCHVPGQLVQDAKQTVEELKDQPCTCDPQPQPW